MWVRGHKACTRIAGHFCASVGVGTGVCASLGLTVDCLSVGWVGGRHVCVFGDGSPERDDRGTCLGMAAPNAMTGKREGAWAFLRGCARNKRAGARQDIRAFVRECGCVCGRVCVCGIDSKSVG